MIRLAISVEGETEEAFVNIVLAEHLWEMEVHPQPSLLGGNVTVERLASDMARLQYSFDFVTSLVDFYGFRDKGNATPRELERRIDENIDRKIVRPWNQTKVFSYVQVHEFEGLLFSNVNAFTGMADALGSLSALDELRTIRARFRTPEDINDSRYTAPSERITKLIPRYNKVADGTQLAESIGLDTIRAECPRFDEWLARLESLGSTPMAE